MGYAARRNTARHDAALPTDSSVADSSVQSTVTKHVCAITCSLLFVWFVASRLNQAEPRVNGKYIMVRLCYDTYSFFVDKLSWMYGDTKLGMKYYPPLLV